MESIVQPRRATFTIYLNKFVPLSVLCFPFRMRLRSFFTIFLTPHGVVAAVCCCCACDGCCGFCRFRRHHHDCIRDGCYRPLLCRTCAASDLVGACGSDPCRCGHHGGIRAQQRLRYELVVGPIFSRGPTFIHISHSKKREKPSTDSWEALFGTASPFFLRA